MLFFSHANGFPAGTYRKLFAQLEPHYRVAAPDCYGHDPLFPVTDGWRHLVRQAAHELALVRQGDEPVILVGHSLGGFLSLMLAASEPAAVRAVVMLDSPVLHGWKAGVIRAAKRVGLAARVPPASVAWRRRDRFASPDDALTHFASKPVFARWDADVLRDYVGCGVCRREDGAGLRFARDVEARIYQTLPHDLGRVASRLRQRVPGLPVGFIRGTRSQEVRQVGLAATRRLVGEHMRQIEGGHLFPMERPAQTAGELLGLLAAMGVAPSLPRAA
ncbi:alpha/beta fold hydrolase [Verticiella sediminum]|uniref:alpha/beta fold hydrolase n=1 Tax=Verticiella sediminum TaxID=1247510 RepID=UPI001FEBCE9A|nr:alpha/beta hydrolase [Verticiella sediminum]